MIVTTLLILMVDITDPFKFKAKTTGTPRNPWKKLSSLWRTPEIPSINSKTNLFVTWSANFVIFNAADATTITITNTKLYVSVVNWSIEDNSRLSQQLTPEIKRTFRWNKYQSKVST